MTRLLLGVTATIAALAAFAPGLLVSIPEPALVLGGAVLLGPALVAVILEGEV